MTIIIDTHFNEFVQHKYLDKAIKNIAAYETLQTSVHLSRFRVNMSKPYLFFMPVALGSLISIELIISKDFMF